MKNVSMPIDAGVWFNPGPTVTGVGKGVDQARATIFEWPILWFSTAYLWNRGWVKRVDGNEFGIGDFIVVTVASWAIKKMAVGARWEAM